MGGGLAYRFTHAIVRTPAKSAVSGIRAQDIGTPDVEKFCFEHESYVSELKAAGLTVEVLEPLEGFPDSCFVEDPAFCLPGRAVLLRPRAGSRSGEVECLSRVLNRRFEEVEALPAPANGEGYVDGGDVLMMDDRVIVGLSERTDRRGAEVFGRILSKWGYEVEIAHTPQGVLHFKTACAALDGETVLATRVMMESGIFSRYRLVEVPEEESYAANCIRVNDVVLAPEGYPQTRAAIERAGYDVIGVPTHEARKLDGGVSCLSLRFFAGEI